MGDLQKADGKLAARVGHALAHTCDGKGLARRSTGEQIEGAERLGAINEVGRGDVAQIGMAEPMGQHSAGELLNFGAPQPFGFGQCQFSATDARETRRGSHHSNPPSSGRDTRRVPFHSPMVERLHSVQ